MSVPANAVPLEAFWTTAERTRETITSLKRSLQINTFEWHPYDSWSNLIHVKNLLGPKATRLVDVAVSDGVLDIGCADGELSFLFEALGCCVTAIDHPTTNHNGMRGLYTLSSALRSKIEIREIDLDMPFTLPDRRHGLALCLGVLYHLKNPFYVLEQIARHCRYCLLSTRVARCLPDGAPLPIDQPIAYLLAADELNQDDSNYWIFSRPALTRMLTRCRFEPLMDLSVGDTEATSVLETLRRHDQTASPMMSVRFYF